MKESFDKFKEEVANGRPRMALEHAVLLFEELIEKSQATKEKAPVEEKAPVKKTAAKKTATSKKDGDEESK